MRIKRNYKYYIYFFNDTATTEIYTLSLHDALPIYEENIEYVNNRFCEMLGYTMDELVGSNANVLFSVSRKASKTMKNKIDERKQGVSSRYELQIKIKNGGIIWVNASGAPLYDFDGNVVGSIGINTDITQRKKVEAELESLSRFTSENPMPVLRY